MFDFNFLFGILTFLLGYAISSFFKTQSKKDNSQPLKAETENNQIAISSKVNENPELNRFSNESNLMKNEISILKKDLLNSYETIKIKEQEKNKLEMDYHQLVNFTKEISREKEDFLKKFNKQNADCQGLIERFRNLDNKNIFMKKNIVALEKEIEAFIKEKEDLLKKLNEQDADYQGLIERFRNLDNKNIFMKKNIVALEKKIENLIKENENLLSKLNASEKDFSILASEKSSFQAQFVSIQNIFYRLISLMNIACIDADSLQHVSFNCEVPSISLQNVRYRDGKIIFPSSNQSEEQSISLGFARFFENAIKEKIERRLRTVRLHLNIKTSNTIPDCLDQILNEGNEDNEDNEDNENNQYGLTLDQLKNLIGDTSGKLL